MKIARYNILRQAVSDVLVSSFSFVIKQKIKIPSILCFFFHDVIDDKGIKFFLQWKYENIIIHFFRSKYRKEVKKKKKKKNLKYYARNKHKSTMFPSMRLLQMNFRLFFIYFTDIKPTQSEVTLKLSSHLYLIFCIRSSLCRNARRKSI